MVNEEGDCLEDETRMKLSGSGMAELKSLTPVANFQNNDKCETEGTVMEIGFDQIGNSKLDKDEINTTASTCALPADDESDGLKAIHSNKPQRRGWRTWVLQVGFRDP